MRELNSTDLRTHLVAMTGKGAMVMAVVGSRDTGEIRELVEREIADQAGKKVAIAQPKPWLAPAFPRQVTMSLLKEQSHLVIGFPGTALGSDDRFAVEILVEILGGHGGRLFAGVRDELGLAYAVTASSIEGIEPGSISLYAATSPGRERALVEAMFEEIKKIRLTPPRAEELKRVKRYLKGGQAIALQRSAARAASMALDCLYGVGYDASMRYPERIEAITVEDVAEVVEKYLVPERAIVACVGNTADSLSLLPADHFA